MNHKIKGGNLPVLIVNLTKGESIITERGGMAWMTTSIGMDTNMKGGLMKGLGRALTGESIFLNTYRCNGNTGMVACASSFPGDILAKQLAPGESIVAQKGAFLCAESSVDVSVHLRKKIGVGLFGGEGFLMQKFQGPGWVFFEIDGSTIKYKLNPGDQLVVDPGHIAVQSPTISTDIKMVKGIKNIAFGGEGLLLAKITGPGEVWLQTMPAKNLAASLIPYLPEPSSD